MKNASRASSNSSNVYHTTTYHFIHDNNKIETIVNKNGFWEPLGYFGNARASQVLCADASHIIIIYCCDDDDERGSIKRDGEKRHRRSPSNTTRVCVICIIICVDCVSATVPYRSQKHNTRTLPDVMYVYNNDNNENNNKCSDQKHTQVERSF